MSDANKPILTGRITKAMDITNDQKQHIGASITLLVLPGQESQLPEPWRSLSKRYMPELGGADVGDFDTTTPAILLPYDRLKLC